MRRLNDNASTPASGVSPAGHDGPACQPADFEKHSAILLGCNELLPYHPQVLTDLVSILIERLPIVAIVNGETQRRDLLTLLCDWGLPVHLLHCVSLPVKGMWVRDYGPAFVRTMHGGIRILDPEYLEPDRVQDDLVPTELANLLKLPVTRVPLLLEGGNMLSNGRGLCLTTTALFDRNQARGRTRRDVENGLREFYGFTRIVPLVPLMAEPTGHVDLFASFVAPDTILLGQYDPSVDPVNCDVLEGNAEVLRNVRTESGTLKVVRIPMPSNRGSIWRTYTNVIYANDVVVVPTYAHLDPAIEQRAMATFAQHLPGWEIVGIDASSVIVQRGSLRCVSAKIPWLDDRFEHARPASPARREVRSCYTSPVRRDGPGSDGRNPQR
ncbi:MAG: agmatine deiminase family protein [Tepidisphaerales bacterium]